MPSSPERRAALEAILAHGGQGRIGENVDYYSETIAPGLSRPDDQYTTAIDSMWDERNQLVAKAARQAIGGYGSALNVARQQSELERLRKLREALAQQPTGGGRGGGGAGGRGPGSTATPVSTVNVGNTYDPWADFEFDLPYTPAPKPAKPPSLITPAPSRIPQRAGGMPRSRRPITPPKARYS